MNGLGALKRVISTVNTTVRRLLGGIGYAGANEGFVCVACHSTYQRQHYQCPTCGEMVLVPRDPDEGDRPGPG